MLLDISLTALDRKRKFWGLPDLVNSGDEIPEHILVDILDLMNICAVFYGLDVVITEGIGCLRDHAAADSCPGDERGGNDRLVLGLTQGITGTEGSSHMVVAVLNVKMVDFIIIVDISVFYMGKKALFQHISAVAAGNIPGLKRLFCMRLRGAELLKTGKIDVFVIAGIVEHPGQLAKRREWHHRNIFHQLQELDPGGNAHLPDFHLLAKILFRYIRGKGGPQHEEIFLKGNHDPGKRKPVGEMKRQSPRFFLNLQKPLPAVQQEEIFQHTTSCQVPLN